MARSKTKKTAKRSTARSSNAVKKLQRYLKQFYYYRWHSDQDDTPLVTHRGYRGLIKPATMDEIEFQVHYTPFIWQCVSITYCRDQWGKEYRLFGFGNTSEPIRVGKQSLRPLLTAAIKHAEDNANSKHIYARGVVMAPWSKEFPDLISVVRARKKELFLTEDDVVGISDYLSEQAVVFEYDKEEADDIDRQIANLI